MTPFPSLITIVPDDGSLREEEWAAVECRSRIAHGCDSVGQAVLEGLTLHARVAGSGRSALRSDLAITMSDEVLRCLGDAEVDEETGMATHLSFSYSKVEAVDKDVAVFTVCFVDGSGLYLYYYLVYDSGAASISMIPHPRWDQCSASYTRPLLVRHGGGDGSGYSLVLMARHHGEREMDVVCIWPPPPSACGYVGPWGMKERRSSKCPSRFRVHVAFTARGRAFWTDLSRGVVHCDCRNLLDGSGTVEFKSTKLPSGYRLGLLQTIEMGHMGAYRTMGVAGDGDRIRFVSIGRASARRPGPDRIGLARIFNEEHDDPENDDLDSDPDNDKPPETEEPCPGDRIVTVWTLDESLRRWSKDMELHLGTEIWGLPEFDAAGLPRTVPLWPFLRPREEEVEDDGGALYFLLPKNPTTRGRQGGYYICRVDVGDGGEAIRLASRHLPTQWTREPLYLPPSLFKCLDPCKVEAKPGGGRRGKGRLRETN